MQLSLCFLECVLFNFTLDMLQLTLLAWACTLTLKCMANNYGFNTASIYREEFIINIIIIIIIISQTPD